MPKQKKDGITVSLYLERSIVENLAKYCEETGQSKTLAVERMLSEELKKYFEQPEGKRIPVK